MKNRLPIFFACAFVYATVSLCFAQPANQSSVMATHDTIRIASYNILNYPGSDATTRNPYFRRVVHTMQPDILVVQEMQSQAGVDNFRNNVLNYYESNLYTSVSFNDGFDTDNAFFYKTSKVQFLGAFYDTAPVLRDIAEYTVKIVGTYDTLRIYSLHLKASQTSEDEQQRLDEATILRNRLNNLPSGSQFLIVGDFNIYTSSEPAFQKLIGSEADNDGRARDPLNAVGSWNNNSTFESIHTQSPRVRAFGGGSNGGMDDRFDMILPSFSSLDDNILTSTYTAYGNDGNHLNDSINHGVNSAVPDSVADALHYGADHIPVFCDFQFALANNPPQPFSLSSPSNGSVNQPISGILSWGSSQYATQYDVYLDTNPDPTTLVSSNQAGTSYNYSGLSNNQTYYWKVIAENGFGTFTATGSPRSFTTIVSLPGSFAQVSPSDGAGSQPPAGTLLWQSSVNAVQYDVYLDVTNPPTTVVSANQADTSYEYNGLGSGITYYWKIVAQNVAGDVTASNAPRNFTTADVPAAPTEIASSNVTTTSLDLSWKDNATDELGYRVYRSASAGGPFGQVGADLPANTILFNDIGLAINERYYYRIVPFNANGEGSYASIDLATMSAVPGIPTIINAEYISMDVTLDPDINPSQTQFAVRAVSDSVVQYAQLNGALGASPVWRTFTEWGGGSGFTLSGLQSCKDYVIDVVARNLDNVATAYGPVVNQSMQCFSVSGSVQNGWNLVSLPVVVADPQKSVVFPTSTSQAFSFNGGYQQKDTLLGGLGYWVKFNDLENILLNGQPLDSDSIELISGWNIIGSISNAISVSSIVEEPTGLVSSSFFGYNGAYTVTDSIYPMQGYWVKANQAGTLILSSTALQNQSVSTHRNIVDEQTAQRGIFTFDDGTGHAQVLTLTGKRLTESQTMSAELPPVPPQGSFDVRFVSQKSTEFFDVSGKAPLMILIQPSRHPVILTWDISAFGDIPVYAEIGPERVPLTQTGSIRIPEGVKQIQLTGGGPSMETIPHAFALYQNYPNPFNPSTEIQYDLPERSFVRLRIYNLLGVEIATLVEGEIGAGFQKVMWSPQISSGMYFYKIDAVSIENPSLTFQKTHRMILLK